MHVTQYSNSLFEQPWWLETVAPSQWHESIIKDKNGDIQARMPYVVQNGRIVMPKLTQTLGIWMSEDSRRDYKTQKKLINRIFEPLLEEYKVIHQNLSPLNDYVLPFRWLGMDFTPGFTYRLENLSDTDSLYNFFSKNTRRDIRRAKRRVKLYYEPDPETLWKMQCKTFEMQNRSNPMDKKLVFRIIENAEKMGCGHYVEARDDSGEVHAAVYFVYDEQVCYYLLAGAGMKNRDSCANTWILWDGIQFASQHSKIFDFEGSMVEGIENFFKQFGGVCTPYYSVDRLSLSGKLWGILKPYIKEAVGYKM